MKRTLVLLLGFTLLSVWAAAARPGGYYNTGTTTQRGASQQQVKRPRIPFTGLQRAFGRTDYVDFLSSQVNILLGDNDSIRFNSLLENAYFKSEFRGLSDQEIARLKIIASKEDSADTVTERELLVILTILDAKVLADSEQGKKQFEMDGYPSLGPDGGLLNVSSKGIDNSFILAKHVTRSAERGREEAKDQRRAQIQEELQRLQVFNQNGSLNRKDAGKAVELLGAFAGAGEEDTLQRMAGLAFGKQLKSARWTGTRSNDVRVVLQDGTALESSFGLGTIVITYPNGTEEKLRY